ncbi:MAG: HAD hydrolase-like protein [Clostridium sp.]|nr:MAG: HAD hydrolase-like protein [Clostridium sp.]
MAEKNHPEINLERAVMVGDTTHDVEVARAMGIDAVTIARGHSARAALEKTGAPVFDNADEMLKYFEK